MGWGGFSGWDFNGTIDDVRVSGTARDSNWINTSYVNQNDPESFYNVSNEMAAGAPCISDISPADGAIDIPLSLPNLSFYLTDFENDSMNYTVTTYPDIFFENTFVKAFVPGSCKS